MQYFINHQTIERAAAEVFSSGRARFYLYGLIGAALATVAGLALGAIWLGLALLVDASRTSLGKHLKPLSPAQSAAASLALDIASSASLAVAPAIAWYSGAALSGAIAATMIVALAAHTAFNAKRGRMHALIACAPYAVLGLTILIESGSLATFAAIAMTGAAIAYVFFAAMYQAHRAGHARMQDAEWVRQLNMSFGDDAAASWEIDFERQSVTGARRLGALVGRPVSYADIVERTFFAPPQDRALVNAAFAPEPGAVRCIALEHEAVRADGSRVRLRHQGFVRTTPDGVPTRVTCITRSANAITGSGDTAPTILATAQAALTNQAEALRTLNNELSAAAETDLGATPAALAAILRALVERGEAIGRGVDDLAHARHEADAANLAKSQFLANMSHELRTPLNAIIGYAEMLQEDAEDNGDTAAVQDLNRILTAAKHLLSLIGEILDLSKIEAGRMEAVASLFDPSEMLDVIVETVRPIAVANGNEIRLNGTLLGAKISTDSMKLQQCVLNLLSNAAKFTKDGKIDVEFDRKRCNGVEQLFVTVRDTGIGMSKEHVSRLFQPFVQADPSITQQYGGTGLGLTITRRLCQLLGGDVTVKSVLGEGSAFTMHVPINLADAATALGAAAKIDDLQGNEGAPLVIVIEDEADARELAARALTRAGFAVQGVGGGEAGLALARAQAPALVLLDIFLPDRSGWRVLQSLKHDPKTQDIPVVVLSVNEDRAHALALGAAEHIVKPADRDMLAATVMRYARKRPAPLAVAPAVQKAAG
ncbi:PAS domain-containing hybrid sensor histidine kinase/response regulator [Candidatus Viadribacter manganicus]|uniref:histidine kinase n=1 Tax=Candidatus Viadribacter manganicus TaxID=1759059 RepID=A0A1B1AFS3_9PROT|nr:PAS domain-containing hybrid sensor histidine kinase/response regulator [Candidatus Viadribacter manganicus]ANP45407.1 hypothetical protein ATE48_05495 [Candidatus Viadribacter manganicus]